MENDVKPDAKPQPKVVAATIGAGVGAAVATVGTWIVESSLTIDVPNEVELALGVIFTAALAFVSGYVKRN